MAWQDKEELNGKVGELALQVTQVDKQWGLKLKDFEDRARRELSSQRDQVRFQRYFNAISTLFQRHFNAISTPFKRHVDARTKRKTSCGWRGGSRRRKKR